MRNRMQHIFILNPAAGNGKIAREIHPQIIEACKQRDVCYEIHRTINIGDAKNFTAKRCEEASEEQIRFYSCGGDGTLNEVLNGLIGYENAELAVIPAGTGNDFVRNFGDWKRFRDIGAQIDGSVTKIDSIRYEFLDLSNEDTEHFENLNLSTEGYALNMFNLGFDAQAVAKAAQYKRKPFVGGTMAYIAGVLNVLMKLKSVKIEIEFDDNILNGDYLLIGVSNGRYSGGGFDGTPQAKINDGLLDINLVSRVNRRFFLSLVKNYHNGTHIDDPRLKDIYSHYQNKKVLLRPESKVIMAIDGETIEVGAAKFSIVEKSVNMVIPEGVEALVPE